MLADIPCPLQSTYWRTTWPLYSPNGVTETLGAAMAPQHEPAGGFSSSPTPDAARHSHGHGGTPRTAPKVGASGACDENKVKCVKPLASGPARGVTGRRDVVATMANRLWQRACRAFCRKGIAVLQPANPARHAKETQSGAAAACLTKPHISCTSDPGKGQLRAAWRPDQDEGARESSSSLFCRVATVVPTCMS